MQKIFHQKQTSQTDIYFYNYIFHFTSNFIYNNHLRHNIVKVLKKFCNITNIPHFIRFKKYIHKIPLIIITTAYTVGKASPFHKLIFVLLLLDKVSVEH